MANLSLRSLTAAHLDTLDAIAARYGKGYGTRSACISKAIEDWPELRRSVDALTDELTALRDALTAYERATAEGLRAMDREAETLSALITLAKRSRRGAPRQLTIPS